MPDVAAVEALTDTHAHLEMVAARLGEDALATALSTLAALGGGEGRGGLEALILDIGVEARDLMRRIALLRRLSGGILPARVRLAAGLWPSKEALADPEASLAALETEIAEAMAKGFHISAVGEGGLDYHHMEADARTQAHLFALQIQLASRSRLPLIVHSRDAASETLEVLRSEAPTIPVIIHCFGYGAAEVRAFLDAGCHISFAGNLTYKKADALRAALALVPDARLLLETDAPYMNPEPRRGRPSSFLDIDRTYEAAALIRGVDKKSLAALVSTNAARLFR